MGLSNFEVDYKFLNDIDFQVVIWNFGIPSIYAAGSRTSAMQIGFHAPEIEAIKQTIEDYFSHPVKIEFWPFNDTRGRCVGIKFPAGWIVRARW